MTYDLKILGGTIIDGSGDARRQGDIGVQKGKIIALGGTSQQTIETEWKNIWRNRMKKPNEENI